MTNLSHGMIQTRKIDMKKKLTIIFLIVCIICFCVSVGILIDYFHSINSSEKTVDKLKDKMESTVPLATDLTGNLIIPSDDVTEPTETVSSYEFYQKLLDENPDFVGWISIPGTNIDYPVVQTPDDEQFYLRKDFYKDSSRAGTIFCSADSDLKTPSMNIIIYGHHMKAGTMFAKLDGYREEDFYKEHKYIIFNTLYQYGTYEVVAAFETDLHSDTYPYYKFINGTEEEYEEFIANIKAETPYETCETQYGDQFITLSTCSYHTSNARYVVVAKKIS